jgi:hypothetical protein
MAHKDGANLLLEELDRRLRSRRGLRERQKRCRDLDNGSDNGRLDFKFHGYQLS